MWCVAKLDEEYIARMEECWGCMKTVSVREPVVCIDEKPVCCMKIHAPHPHAAWTSCPARLRIQAMRNRQRVLRRRAKAGRHFTKVTATRCSAEFADYLLKIAVRYPAADTIHLVMDNLSTHTQKALVERSETPPDLVVGPIHDPLHPKHGSWLNQAEMEVSMFSRQCLGKRRIEDIAACENRLAHGTAASIRTSHDSVEVHTPTGQKTLHYTITRSKH